jgi:DNA-binding MarR family transcriptional regulator
MVNADYLDDLATKKSASTAQLLFRCARLLNEQALARVRRETGIAEIRASHTALLPHLDFEGVRLTDLAERVGVSKQAAFQLVEELEAHGIVERRDDPADGRARLIRFSKKGQRALLNGLRILGELERELARDIGAQRFAALHDALIALLPVLERGAVSPPPSPLADDRPLRKKRPGRKKQR